MFSVNQFQNHFPDQWAIFGTWNISFLVLDASARSVRLALLSDAFQSIRSMILKSVPEFEFMDVEIFTGIQVFPDYPDILKITQVWVLKETEECSDYSDGSDS